MLAEYSMPEEKIPELQELYNRLNDRRVFKQLDCLDGLVIAYPEAISYVHLADRVDCSVYDITAVLRQLKQRMKNTYVTIATKKVKVEGMSYMTARLIISARRPMLPPV